VLRLFKRRARPLLMAGAGLLGTVVVATAAVCLGTGCSTLGYYAQAVNGHLDLLQRARPVVQVQADAQTPAALRERLALSQRMRDFAVTELHLPDNSSYRRYADLNRSAAVWNVVAAPELSLTLKTWCFPVLGCVGYRGYYDRPAAEELASSLRQQGLEVRVYGVPAYSTLGYSNWVGGDPLLNTFINWPEIELAQLIFHELSHQVVYAEDDTTFNESFATAVERIGGRRWLEQQGAGEETLHALAQRQQRQHDFRELTQRLRGELQAVYSSTAGEAAKRQQKAAVMARMHSEYATLKAERWGGFAGYDTWFANANNAYFAVLAAYTELVPEFERLFESQGRQFPRFYAEVRRIAGLPKDQRRAALAAAHGVTPPGPRDGLKALQPPPLQETKPWPTSRFTAHTAWAWRRRARWPGAGLKTWKPTCRWNAR
jgi:predicted aminopeptidase